MVEAELDRDALHQPLDREIKLRAAEAPDQARRHFVGEHDTVRHIDVPDVVGPRHRAVHAVERARHRRAQEGAVVLALVETQREDAALFGDRGLDLGDAVRPRACGDEMLDAVLDPFHRPPGDLRRDRGQHHVGKHRELDAEAAAAVGRDAQPHLGAGHPQRLRHHRMGREWPLEIRGDVVALVVGMVLGDDDVALHRREGEPRVVHGERHPGIGTGKGAGGIAVGEFADRDLVGLAFGVEQRRRFVAGGDGVDHSGQRLVIDLDQLRGILRHIPVLGDDQRHRLADITHPLDRERPLVHRRLERNQERIGECAHVLAGDDRGDPRQAARSRRIDAADDGMGVGRTDHMGLQRAARLRQIVGIAAAPRQQCGVFLAGERHTERGHQSTVERPSRDHSASRVERGAARRVGKGASRRRAHADLADLSTWARFALPTLRAYAAASRKGALAKRRPQASKATPSASLPYRPLRDRCAGSC